MALRKVEPLASTDPLADYDEDYLECRWQHTWRKVGYYRDSGLISKLSYCTRCHTRRIQTLYASGVIAANPRYEYPEGFRLEGGVQKYDVRRETMRRASGELFNSADELAKARLRELEG